MKISEGTEYERPIERHNFTTPESCEPGFATTTFMQTKRGNDQERAVHTNTEKTTRFRATVPANIDPVFMTSEVTQKNKSEHILLPMSMNTDYAQKNSRATDKEAMHTVMTQRDRWDPTVYPLAGVQAELGPEMKKQLVNTEIDIKTTFTDPDNEVSGRKETGTDFIRKAKLEHEVETGLPRVNKSVIFNPVLKRSAKTIPPNKDPDFFISDAAGIDGRKDRHAGSAIFARFESRANILDERKTLMSRPYQSVDDRKEKTVKTISPFRDRIDPDLASLMTDTTEVTDFSEAIVPDSSKVGAARSLVGRFGRVFANKIGSLVPTRSAYDNSDFDGENVEAVGMALGKLASRSEATPTGNLIMKAFTAMKNEDEDIEWVSLTESEANKSINDRPLPVYRANTRDHAGHAQFDDTLSETSETLTGVSDLSEMTNLSEATVRSDLTRIIIPTKYKRHLN